jgi:hypothetical protein
VLLMEAIPDIPAEISIQLHRQRILVEKVIFRLKDVEKNGVLGTDSSLNDPSAPNTTAASGHGLVPSSSFSSADHFHIHDYHSFLQQQKRGPFSPKKQFSTQFVSNRLFDIFADDDDDHAHNEEEKEVTSSGGMTTPNRSPHSPMPAVYTLPSPGRKKKYSYTRSSTVVSSTSRVVDDNDEEDEPKEGEGAMDKEA